MDLSRNADLPQDLRDLMRFADTVAEAQFRLTEIVGTLHGDRQLANTSRAVLRYVIANGPRTVPEIAHWRSTSRQFIQKIVDGLVDQDLVTLADNPQHQRSRLVTVGEKGRAYLTAMIAKEAHLLQEGLNRSGASLAEVRAATDLINRFIGVIGTLKDELDTGDRS